MAFAENNAGAAKAVLKHHGRSFHFASHLLGARHGERAARLYALCRAIDDLADDATDPSWADDRLASLSNAIAMEDRADPIAAAALALQHDTGFHLGALEALIAGVRTDLKPVALADEAALVDYAYAVAGTVGLMMCAVLDVDDARAHPFAIDLGIAMQLTNIARDVGTDARLGRRYLPASWVGEIAPEALGAPAGALENSARKAVARTLQLAERYYESGEAGLGFLPARARFAILTAARVYRAIGTRIASEGYRPWMKRAVVSDSRKVAIGLRAGAAFLMHRHLHSKHHRHDPELHLAIRHRPGAEHAGGAHG
jgi:phytoene synthase